MLYVKTGPYSAHISGFVIMAMRDGNIMLKKSANPKLGTFNRPSNSFLKQFFMKYSFIALQTKI